MKPSQFSFPLFSDLLFSDLFTNFKDQVKLAIVSSPNSGFNSRFNSGLGFMLNLGLNLGLSCLISLFVMGNPVVHAGEMNVSKGNLGNDVLYYVTIDRFFDGNPANNIPDFAFPSSPETPKEQAYAEANRSLLPYLYDPTHQYFGLFWGGDLEGIIQKLDYLQDLGVTQLILSPIQDNTNGMIYAPGNGNYLRTSVDPQADSFNPFYAGLFTSFQGTWPKDWFELEEHFRSVDTDPLSSFRRLLKEAGDRNISIILELSLNNGSPSRNSLDYRELNLASSEQWFVDQGAIYRHGEKVADYWNPQTGELNPQGWFHEPLSINYNRPTPKSLEQGTVGGPDLNQDNPQVRDYLLDAIVFWLSVESDGYSISGFYLDTIENINVSFWQALENQVHALKPDAILIGDYSGGGYTNRSSIDWYTHTQDYTLTNNGLSLAARHFFARDRNWDGRTYVLREQTLGHEGQYYNYSPVETIAHQVLNPSESLEIPRQSLDQVADEDAKGWVNFIETHNQPRLFSSYPQMSDRAYANLIRFLFASPGVPLLMYGTETGLATPYHIDHNGLFGVGGYPFNEPMMIWPDEAGWNTDIFETTRQMIHLRQKYPVLRYGQTSYLFPQGSRKDSDIFMLRKCDNSDVQVVKDLDRESCDKDGQILYAYSTFGGNFTLSLDNLGINQVVSLDSGEVISDTHLLHLDLEPEASQILFLAH